MIADVLGEARLRSLVNSAQPPYVLLDASSGDNGEEVSYFFSDFEHILIFKNSDDPADFFHTLQNYLDKQYWAAGYLSYELGYYLEPALRPLQKGYDFDLAWFGLTRKPLLLERGVFTRRANQPVPSRPKISDVMSNLSETDYVRAIEKIKLYLEQGDTYQVNFTFKLKFDYEHEPLELYLRLRRLQPTAYSAFINTGREYILSHSPELFFKRQGSDILTRPMKGTIPRGLSCEADKAAQNLLRESEKTRAENIMIVDLLRNDLGRISSKVWTCRLFEVERHATLHQMTSTIQAKLKPNLSWQELFCSLFPSGSVTGAPKIRTMQIINALEKEPRNIYTGAIGFLSPCQKACFNVAIRTIRIKDKKGEMGIGGGIVYDSVAVEEHGEALLKGSFLFAEPVETSLIETMRFEPPESFYLLDLHLQRLERSCEYFRIPFDRAGVIDRLRKAVACKACPQKVRMTVNSRGQVFVEVSDLERVPQMAKVVMSQKKVSKDNPYLYHKTTQRQLYEQEYAWAKKQGFYEVVFSNKEKQITEGSFTNIFIEKAGVLYTPPLSSGLLPGTFREQLLKEKKVFEKVLYPEDLVEADAIYIGNSVRGLIRVEFFRSFEKQKASGTIWADEKYSQTAKA